MLTYHPNDRSFDLEQVPGATLANPGSSVDNRGYDDGSSYQPYAPYAVVPSEPFSMGTQVRAR